jgi:hypothetical protein
MSGIACAECGAKLRVTIHAGEFFIREGSTLDDINFEKVKKVDLEKAEMIDEDVMLQVQVECSTNPSHMIFGHAVSRIKNDIYTRIETGARRLRAQHL